MAKITPVDISTESILIHLDLSISAQKRKPGPPERIDGLTVGVFTVDHYVPPHHGGEVHPDGDEILIVTSGALRVTGESDPMASIEVRAGQACIVRKGEWHKVTVLEFPTQVVHITPGPNANYRPVENARGPLGVMN
jgi:mannose-6-phosphate isomerase-like protein (cupin superfamily)